MPFADGAAVAGLPLKARMTLSTLGTLPMDLPTGARANMSCTDAGKVDGSSAMRIRMEALPGLQLLLAGRRASVGILRDCGRVREPDDRTMDCARRAVARLLAGSRPAPAAAVPSTGTS